MEELKQKFFDIVHGIQLDINHSFDASDLWRFVEKEFTPKAIPIKPQITEIIDHLANTLLFEIEGKKQKADTTIDKLYYNGQQQATLELHGKIIKKLEDSNLSI